MPNRMSSSLLNDFLQYMKDNGTSEDYQKGNLKATIHFAEYLGPVISHLIMLICINRLIRFFWIQRQKMIKSMLIRSGYKTAWNDYLWLLSSSLDGFIIIR